MKYEIDTIEAEISGLKGLDIDCSPAPEMPGGVWEKLNQEERVVWKMRLIDASEVAAKRRRNELRDMGVKF